MERSVTVTHLEMTSPSALEPLSRVPRLELRRVEIPSPEVGRFLYVAVGSEWWWHERLTWSRDRWLDHLERPETEMWIAYESGTPAGYFELESQPNRQVEIAYLGLLPSFIGRGLGTELLRGAAERAWALDPRRVWLHTCSLDHPRALATYEAGGFTVFKVEEVVQLLPSARPRLWLDGD